MAQVQNVAQTAQKFNYKTRALFISSVCGLGALVTLAGMCFAGVQMLGTMVELADGERRKEISVVRADSLRQTSDDLTRFARLYAVTGDKEFADNYQNVLDIRNGEAPRPINYDQIYWDLSKDARTDRHPAREPKPLSELLDELALLPAERELLRQSHSSSDFLARTELSVFAVVENEESSQSDIARARAALFSDAYLNAKTQVMLPLEALLHSLEVRRQQEIDIARREFNHYLWALCVFGAAFAFIAAWGWRVIHRDILPAALAKRADKKFRVVGKLFLFAAAFFITASALMITLHSQFWRSAVEMSDSRLAVDEMRQSSDDLTRFAQLYAETGKEQFKNDYQTVLDIRNGDAARPSQYHHIYWELSEEERIRDAAANNLEKKPLLEKFAEIGVRPDELELIAQSQELSDNLTRPEEEMFAVFDNASSSAEDRNRVREFLFSTQYLFFKSEIMLPLDDLLTALRKRCEDAQARLSNYSDAVMLLFGASVVGFALLVLLAMGMVYSTDMQVDRRSGRERVDRRI